MNEEKYLKLWLCFLNIKPKKGLKFSDLIDVEEQKTAHQFKGAWANILIKALTINEALNILPLGLDELGFDVEFIDKVENIQSLIDASEITGQVISEADWLLKSEFVFKISDKIFPYE